jgi:hypothetical protein
MRKRAVFLLACCWFLAALRYIIGGMWDPYMMPQSSIVYLICRVALVTKSTLRTLDYLRAVFALSSESSFAVPSTVSVRVSVFIKLHCMIISPCSRATFINHLWLAEFSLKPHSTPFSRLPYTRQPGIIIGEVRRSHERNSANVAEALELLRSLSLYLSQAVPSFQYVCLAIHRNRGVQPGVGCENQCRRLVEIAGKWVQDSNCSSWIKQHSGRCSENPRKWS